MVPIGRVEDAALTRHSESKQIGLGKVPKALTGSPCFPLSSSSSSSSFCFPSFFLFPCKLSVWKEWAEDVHAALFLLTTKFSFFFCFCFKFSLFFCFCFYSCGSHHRLRIIDFFFFGARFEMVHREQVNRKFLKERNAGELNDDNNEISLLEFYNIRKVERSDQWK